jgi:RNA polymerase sigma-70 factor (family 1)
MMLDSNTLQAFNAGENHGFNAVFKCYYRELRYFIEKIINNREEAEDITVQLFTKLFKMHGQFDTSENIKAFLFITARNTCLNYLSSEQRNKKRLKKFTDLQSTHSPVIPDNELLHQEMIEAYVLNSVYEEVERLPNECRRIFKMLYIEGLKPSEIAKELNLTPETIRSQKRRALQLLRIRLSDNQMALIWILWLGFFEYGSLFVKPRDLA